MVSAAKHEPLAEATTATMAAPPPREDGRTEAGFVQQPAAATPAMQRDGATAGSATERSEPLLAQDQATGYHHRWEEIQTGFVDEPRHAVEQADQLVAEVIKRIAEVFADERSKLEGQWSKGDQVDTEALRQALRRYRSFFERLLSA
jgi:hypothetical protein